MKKVIAISLIFIGLGMASCNKDQSAVKKLDGTWKIVEQDGDVLPDSLQSTYNFTSCKLKSEDYCPAMVTYADNTTENFEYKVSGDGTVLTWKVDDGGGSSFELIGTIDELTKTDMTVTFTFFGTTVSKFKKQ